MLILACTRKSEQKGAKHWKKKNVKLSFVRWLGGGVGMGGGDSGGVRDALNSKLHFVPLKSLLESRRLQKLRRSSISPLGRAQD